MSATIFKVGGPLTEDNAAVYVTRQGDQKVIEHLNRMDYLMVIEPRQQGKTSLIYHIMRHPVFKHWGFCYIVMSSLDQSSTENWYETLGSEILGQLSGIIPEDQQPYCPKNVSEWRNFLLDIATIAQRNDKKILFALDEILAVGSTRATDFFSVLFDVYVSRGVQNELKHITFLLSGVFHPQDLIRDENISPFNIARRIELTDFTEKQVLELFRKGRSKDDPYTNSIAKHIYNWTEGQPYLAQRLCSDLMTKTNTGDVDIAVKEFLIKDTAHLPPIIERLKKKYGLLKYLKGILKGKQIKYTPLQNDFQNQLELLGVIKVNETGYCIIRNTIYKKALDGLIDIEFSDE